MKKYHSQVLGRTVRPLHFSMVYHAKVMESALQAEVKGLGQRVDVFNKTFTYQR